MSSVFDEDALMDRVDDDIEFLAETIAILNEEGPPLLEQIRDSAALRDASALTQAAHTLRGMLSNFCAEPAETAARKLEMLARQNQLDDVETAVATVQREAELLRDALHAFLRMKMG